MRPIWKGAISFGLVNIPVTFFAAVRREELRFHFLRKGDLRSAHRRETVGRGWLSPKAPRWSSGLRDAPEVFIRPSFGAASWRVRREKSAQSRNQKL